MNSINQDLQATHEILTLLEQSKRKSDEVLDQLPGIFAVVTAGASPGRVLKGNVSLSDHFHVGPEKVLNQHLSSLFRPEAWPIFLSHMTRIQELNGNQSIEFELSIRTGDEDLPYFWHLTQFSLREQDGRHLISVIGRDISVLRNTERNLAEIFANIPLGIFTIGKDKLIEKKYSSYLEVVLGTSDVAGKDLKSLLYSQIWEELKPAARESVIGIVECINGPSMLFDVHSGQFPEDVKISFNTKGETVERYLGVRVHPVLTDDIVHRLLVIVEDKTSIVRARLREEKMREMEEKSISIILQLKRCSSELLPLVMEETTGLIARLTEQLKTPVARDLAQTLHGIKGNVRVAGFTSLKSLVHEVESDLKLVDGPLRAADLGKVQRILSDWVEVQRLYQAISKTMDFSTPRGSDLDLNSESIEEVRLLFDKLTANYGKAQTFESAILIERIELALRSFSFVKAEQLRPILNSRVTETAQTVGKKAKLVFDSGDVRLAKSCKTALSEALMHTLNNCLAHGIETPEVRVQLGKSEEGVIKVTLTERFGEINCIVEDDGAGINVDRVKMIALKKGLINLDQSLSMKDEDARNLIFVPGFSTVEEITEVAGRGVGMDAIQAVVDQFFGKITVEPSSPCGTKITFSLRDSHENSTVRRIQPLADVLEGLRNSMFSMASDYGSLLQFDPVDLAAFDENGLIYCDALRVSLAITIYCVSLARRGSVMVSISERKDRFLEIVARLDNSKERHQAIPIPLEYDVPLSLCNDFITQHGGSINTLGEDQITITFGRILVKAELEVIHVHLNLPVGSMDDTQYWVKRITSVAQKLQLSIEVVVTQSTTLVPSWYLKAKSAVEVPEFTAIPTSERSIEIAFIIQVENKLGIKIKN